MKKIYLLIVACQLITSAALAQQGNVRITGYAGFSIDPPNFVLNGNNVELTFSTNLSYLKYPVAGPAAPFPLTGSQINVPNWGPFYAEIGMSGTTRMVAYVDYQTAGSLYNIYQTFTTDSGANWNTPAIIHQVASGSSITSNQYNPSLRSANSNMYALLQSYTSPDSGLISIYKMSPPLFVHNLLFQPYDASYNIFPDDVNYSVKQVSGNTYHLLSYFDDSKMYFQKSSDDGMNLTTPIAIWNGTSPNIVYQNVQGTDMDFDDQGRVAIVWSIHGEYNGFQIFDRTYLAYSDNFGSSFSVDTLPGINALDPVIRIKSDGQQVITYKNQSNHIVTITTDHLLATTSPIQITDTNSTEKFHAELFNGEYLCVAWEDSRFGFGLQEIYYDTLRVPSAALPPSGENIHPEDNMQSAVYPNPFASFAKLDVSNYSLTEKTILEIYDVCGRNSETINEINSSEILIQKKDKISGFYFYVLRNEYGILTKGKMVVQ